MLRFNLFNKNIFRWLLPVAIVVLSVLLIQNIFSRKEYSVQELSPQDGVLDIRGSGSQRRRIYEINGEFSLAL